MGQVDDDIGLCAAGTQGQGFNRTVGCDHGGFVRFTLDQIYSDTPFRMESQTGAAGGQAEWPCGQSHPARGLGGR